MSENDRQQRMVERILEDEQLRGDLEDSAASVLVQWASERAGAAAADSARPDDVVEAEVQAVRAAAREAARSGETDPQRLVAQAEAALAQRQRAIPATDPAATTAAPPAAAPRSPSPAAQAAATSQTSAAPHQRPDPTGRTGSGRGRPVGRPWRRWSRFTGWWKRLRKDR